MLTTDTNQLLFTAESCKDFKYFSRKDATPTERKQYPEGLVSVKSANKFCPGGVIVEFNSKILPEHKLINAENAGQVLDIVQGSRLVKLTSDAYDTAFCLTLDTTTDVVVSDVTQALQLIKACVHVPEFCKKPYARNDNVTFIYDKSNRGKYAGNFKLYHKSEWDKSGYFPANTLRAERRHPNGLSIQTACNVTGDAQGRILWKSILESNMNPVADQYDRITRNLYTTTNMNTTTAPAAPETAPGISKQKLFRHYLSQNKPRKAIDYFNTLVAEDFSLENVYQSLRPALTNKAGREKVLQPYAELLSAYVLFNEGITMDYELLSQIRQQLRYSAAA